MHENTRYCLQHSTGEPLKSLNEVENPTGDFKLSLPFTRHSHACKIVRATYYPLSVQSTHS